MSKPRDYRIGCQYDGWWVVDWTGTSNDPSVYGPFESLAAAEACRDVLEREDAAAEKQEQQGDGW